MLKIAKSKINKCFRSQIRYKTAGCNSGLLFKHGIIWTTDKICKWMLYEKKSIFTFILLVSEY